MAKRKIKKLKNLKKLSDNKKENLCVAAIFGLIAVALIGASVKLLIDNNGGNISNNTVEVTNGRTQEPQSTEPGTFPELENGEWIDCMPPLDDYEVKLCKEAEARGYDKIAY